ncbi:MAG: hypothetical protein ACE5JX_06445 [Acidobacteriota bacterium]
MKPRSWLPLLFSVLSVALFAGPPQGVEWTTRAGETLLLTARPGRGWKVEKPPGTSHSGTVNLEISGCNQGKAVAIVPGESEYVSMIFDGETWLSDPVPTPGFIGLFRSDSGKDRVLLLMDQIDSTEATWLRP